MGSRCRFFPTCSEYFIDCLNEHGLLKGTLKGMKRIFSCHPIKFLGGGDGFDPVKKNNITIFFLQSKTKLENNFLTLEESISKSLVDIKEINSKGTIRYLKVSNKSNQKLLILGSEQIIGNALKQNRVVNNTTLVPEQTTILLSVSCCD